MEDGIHFLVPILFDHNSAIVKSEEAPQVARLAHVLQQAYPSSYLTVRGYADRSGSKEYNLALSRRRAEAVRDALVRNGLSSKSIRIAADGAVNEIVPGATGNAAGADANRRVVVTVESMGALAVSP